MNYLRRTGLAFLIGLPIVFLSGCLNDDEDYTGRIKATDQIAIQNNILIQEFAIEHPGWLAIYRSVSGTPAELLIKPVYLNSKGKFTNNFIQFDSTAHLEDGMEALIMLHVDNGEPGKFEYSPGGALDQPVVVNEQEVKDVIKISSPFVSVEDQPIEDNKIVIDEVQTAFRSWVGVYLLGEEGELGDLAGFAPINQSPLKDIEVKLNTSLTYEPGDLLAVRLHVNDSDDPAKDPDKLNYPDGNDVPQVFGYEENNEIISYFTIQ